jgi:hypothetical protein
VPKVALSCFVYYDAAKIENQFGKKIVPHFVIIKPLLNLQDENKTGYSRNTFDGSAFAGQMCSLQLWF